MAWVGTSARANTDTKQHDAPTSKGERVVLTGESTVTSRYMLQHADQLMSNLRSANDCINAILALASVLFYNSYVAFAPFTSKRMAYLPSAKLPVSIAQQCTACKGAIANCQLCAMMTSIIGLLHGAGIHMLESQNGLGLACLSGATIDLHALQDKMVEMVYGHYKGFQARAANPQIALADSLNIPDQALRQIPPPQSITGPAGKNASDPMTIQREEVAKSQLRASYKEMHPKLIQHQTFKSFVDLARKAATEAGVNQYLNAAFQMQRSRLRIDTEKQHTVVGSVRKSVPVPIPLSAAAPAPVVVPVQTDPVTSTPTDDDHATPSASKKRLSSGATVSEVKSRIAATSDEVLNVIRKVGSNTSVRVEFENVKARLLEDTKDRTIEPHDVAWQTALRRWKETLVDELVYRPKFDRVPETVDLNPSVASDPKQEVQNAVQKLVQARQYHVGVYLKCCYVTYKYCQSTSPLTADVLNAWAKELKLKPNTLRTYRTTGECVHLAPALIHISPQMCMPSFFSQLSKSILFALKQYQRNAPAEFLATWGKSPAPKYPPPNASKS